MSECELIRSIVARNDITTEDATYHVLNFNKKGCVPNCPRICKCLWLQQDIAILNAEQSIHRG